MVKEINVFVYREDHPVGFQFFTGMIEKMYLNEIPKNKIDIKKINIFFTNFKSVNEEKNILTINSIFDFKKFNSLKSNHLKKKYIIESLHNSIIEYFKLKQYNFSSFIIAYEKVYENNLTYSWWTSARHKKSPNKKFYVNLYHFVDIKKYEIFEVLFDSEKQEIARRICFKDILPIFKIETLEWVDDNNFYYKFFNASKRIYVNINSLLENEKYNVNITTSEYFKIRSNSQ